MSELDRMIFVYNIIKIRFIVVLLKKKNVQKTEKVLLGFGQLQIVVQKTEKDHLGFGQLQIVLTC